MRRILSSEHGDETITVKIISIFILFIIALLFGFIPIFWKNYKGNKQLYGFVNSFSAGIFLSFGMIHLLPEVDEKFSEEMGGHDGNHPFPWAYFITTMTYILILMIERVLFDHDHGHGHGHGGGEERALNIQQQNDQTLDLSGQNNHAPYVLMIAFCFHDVIEGVAIGLQKEEHNAINLLIAVCLHKWAQCLSLGANFVQINKSQAIKMIILMAFFQPFGIGIGWIISHSSEIVANIFMAMSIGTFLYISTTEIIPEEFSKREYRWSKFLGLFLGIAVIVGQWFYESNNVHAEH